MLNCLFAYPDYTLGNSVYTSTISGGSWLTGLPLSNLKNKLRTKVARSSNALAASTTFNVDLGAVRLTRLVAMLNHNSTVNGTIRVQFYSDAGYSVLVYDTGIKNIIDYAFTAEDLLNWKPDWWLSFNSVSARYVKVSISDTANPAGYFELGRMCIMGAWSPAGVNIAWGQSIYHDHSNTQSSKAVGGTKYFDRRASSRVSSFTFEALQPGDAHSAWLEMQRRLGVDGEVFLVKDPAETDFFRKQQSFLGNITQQNPLENAYMDAFSTGMTVTEIV